MQSIRISIPHISLPFTYEIICEKECSGKIRSKDREFTVQLRQGTLYQIKVNDSLTRILTVNEKTCKVVIGAHSTIASIFCFSRLLNQNAEIAKYCYTRLNVAESMMRNLVINDKVSRILLNGPNAMETNSLMLFNFLSNILLACLNDSVSSQKLKDITGQVTLLEAFLYISRNPFSYISEIFVLGNSLPQRYIPTITSIDQIGQFTLTVKVNSSGDINYLPGGPGAMTIDKCQNVWISLNVVQGTEGSNTWAMVLDKGARPTTFSPVFPVLGGAYGVAYDKYRDTVLMGSFGWGSNTEAYNPYKGSITAFETNGCVSGIYDCDLHRVQGILVDKRKNVWMCSWGSKEALGGSKGFASTGSTGTTGYNSSIVVYIEGDPTKRIIYTIDYTGPSQNYGPFSICSDSRNNIFVSIGGYKDSINSAILKLRLDCDCKRIIKVGEYIASDYFFYKGIASDSQDNIIVASFDENKVLMFNNDLSLITEYFDDASGPWGIHIDSTDNVWVSNFFAVDELKKGFYVTKLRNCNNTLSLYGKFKVPSGGDPVTLETGETLKNPDKKDIYEPLMRQTYSLSDAAGNIYVTNNWKPSLFEDVFKETSPNPGGDGIVVFIGCASPRKLK